MFSFFFFFWHSGSSYLNPLQFFNILFELLTPEMDSFGQCAAAKHEGNISYLLPLSIPTSLIIWQKGWVSSSYSSWSPALFQSVIVSLEEALPFPQKDALHHISLGVWIWDWLHFFKCMFFNSNQTTRLSGHSVCCVPLPCLYLICCFSYLYITVNLQEGDKPLRSISCSFKAREHISVTGTSSLFRDFFSPNFISNCRSIDTKLYTVTKWQ